MNKNEILELVNLYNEKYNEKLKTSGTKKTLITSILQGLNLNNEKELYKADFIPAKIKSKLKKFTYKPDVVKRKNEWLTTDDLNNVMIQFSRFFKKHDIPFKFVGVFPAGKMTSIDAEKYKKLKMPIGIIFNTDPWYKKGTHWVSVFINGDSVEYFDPNGDKPGKFILPFLEKFNNISYNPKKYQIRDGLCGIYSIHFLTKRAYNIPLNLEKNPDTTISNSKKNYFNL